MSSFESYAMKCPKCPEDFLNEFDFIDKALEFAPYEDGDTGKDVLESELEALIDPVLIAAGQKFVKKYTCSIMLATLFGTGTGGVTFKCLLGTLLRTGKVFQFQRQIRAFVIFINWAKSLDSKKAGPSFQSILRVRKIHSQVTKLMRNSKTKPDLPIPDPENVLSTRQINFVNTVRQDLNTQFKPRVQLSEKTILNFDPPVHFSQLDMILVQLTTFGYAIGFPERLGITDTEDSPKFKGFVLIAGIICKCLGMDDKWNVCLWKHGSLSPRLVFQRIWYDITIPCFSQIDQHLYSIILKAAEPYCKPMISPFHTKQGLYVFQKYGFELKAPETWKTLTKRDKTMVYIIMKLFNTNKNSKYFRNFYNCLIKGILSVSSKVVNVQV